MTLPSCWREQSSRHERTHWGRRGREEKLITVALPLVAINKASVREQFPSQRHRSAATISSYNRKMLLHQRRREGTYVCPTNEFVDMQVLLEGGICLIEVCYPGLVQRGSDEWLFEVSA